MRKVILISAAIALIASSAVAGGLKTEFAAGGAGGFTQNWSGATNFSKTSQFGNSMSQAGTQSYGQSESTFDGGFIFEGKGNGNGNGFDSDAAGLGTVNSASGSQSIAETGSAGNGFSSAETGGSGFGAGVSFGGAGVFTGKSN